MKLARLLVLTAFCAASCAVHAQWQWIDKDGRKVFSDRPPPADVAEKNILKRPPGARAPDPEPAAAAPEQPPATARTGAVAAKPAASAPKISGKDKELEEKKKKAEEAEAAKKKAEADRVAGIKAENCARAKQAKASYDSGVRLARMNDKGEREVIDDSIRASETKRLQAIIDSDCKP